MDRLNAETYRKTLTKLLERGPLQHYPRRRGPRVAFMCAAAKALGTEVIGSEKELNLRLREWLEAMGASGAIDHVTLRRYMVDARLLNRDPGGRQYRVDREVLEHYLGPDAEEVDPVAVAGEARYAYEARQKSRH